MSYNKGYLFEHNVDWFGCINGRWIYAASRGGLLPPRVDDEKMLPRLQGICSNLPDIFNHQNEIVTNTDFIINRYKRALDFYRRRLKGDNNLFSDFTKIYSLEFFTNNFVDLFFNMAVKGFYTYVRTNLEDSFSINYSLVAYPRNEVPTTVNETIRNPYNDNLNDNKFTEYINKISVDNPNLSIDNLDGMF